MQQSQVQCSRTHLVFAEVGVLQALLQQRAICSNRQVEAAQHRPACMREAKQELAKCSSAASYRAIAIQLVFR
jgi:hypothetical protein